jgi:hypothetical protein
MPKVTDSFRNAQILADFCNLESSAPQGHPTHPDYFRNNHPDFAPKAWWDSQYTSERDWEPTQKLLRRAWGNQFQDGIHCLLSLLESVTEPLRLSQAHRAGFEKVKEESGKQAAEETARRFLRGRAVSPSEFRESDHIPMQRAIVYLFEHSWRARFCAKCNKRFVASVPRSKYCSDTCSKTCHKHQKRVSWHRHKKEWRPPRNRRKKHRGGRM